MYCKGWTGVFKAELRAAEDGPRFKKISTKSRCCKKQARPKFLKYCFQNKSMWTQQLRVHADSLWEQ